MASETPTRMADDRTQLRWGVNRASPAWPMGTLCGLPSTLPYGLREVGLAADQDFSVVETVGLEPTAFCLQSMIGLPR